MFTLLRQLALVTASLWFGFDVGGRCEAGTILATPPGLSPGDTFRFVFVTDGSTTAISSDIAVYNAFVNIQAGGATYDGSIVSWVAIGSTGSVNAIDNVGQTQTPVYEADGTLVTASTTPTGLWAGIILVPISEDLDGTLISNLVWTGTFPTGSGGPFPLGAPNSVLAGESGLIGAAWVDHAILHAGEELPMYGISQVLTVGPSTTPEPSTMWMAGTAIIGVSVYGWFRKRGDQRGQSPLGLASSKGVRATRRPASNGSTRG